MYIIYLFLMYCRLNKEMTIFAIRINGRRIQSCQKNSNKGHINFVEVFPINSPILGIKNC